MLGGTFNPPHVGHLALARDALRELGLDLVLMVPAHTPPHKPTAAGAATPSQRLSMCKLATEGVDGLRACALEVRRGGPSYTVDTLEEIHDAHPHARLTLIVGADMALTLADWRRPQRLLELADVVVAERSGAGRERVRQALRPLGPRTGQVSFLAMRPIDVSSSEVRERVASGAPIGGLLPAEVEQFIFEHGLYRAASAAGQAT